MSRVSADEWHKQGLEMLEKGDFRGIGRLWGFLFWKDGEGKIADVERESANKMLGLPEEDLVEVIREVPRG